MRQDISRFIPKGINNSIKVANRGADLRGIMKKTIKASKIIEKPDLRLNFSGLKKTGVKVVASENMSGVSYKVTASSFIARTDFMRMLKYDNPEISFYDEDIDDNELINKTDNPLWTVCKKGNSYIIKRNN